jgi:hypothetical protein
MKFILSENKQFRLEERFILQETSIAEVAQKWAAQLADAFSNTDEVLKKCYKFAGNHRSDMKVQSLQKQLDKAAEDFVNSLGLPATEIANELTKLKAELFKYIQILKQVFEKIKETDSRTHKEVLLVLASRVRDLEDFHKKNSWEATDLDSLVGLVEDISKDLTPVFEAKSGNSEAAIEQFKGACEESLKLIRQVEENLPTDFSKITAEELKSFKEGVNKAITAAKDLPKAEEVTQIWVFEHIKELQLKIQAIKEAYSQLEKLQLFTQQANNRAKAAANAERTFAGQNEIDWKTKYAKAINKATVIEEFIYTTWPKQGDIVARIKEAIAQECEEFGFKPSDADGKNGNPFIEFISKVYLKYNIKPEAYNVIHNLVANGKLKAADLVAAESSTLGKGNLIFCKDLYNQETSVIKLYINKQNNLLKATNKPDMFSSIPEMVFNMLYKLPEIVTGPKIKTDGARNLKINTLPAIEELEAKWTGAVSETKLDPEDKPEKTRVVNADLINKLTTPADAAKLLVALATKFSSDANILAVVESCAEAKQLLTQPTTLTDVQKLVASVERAYDIKNISTSQALSLAKSILDAADKLGLTRA